MILPVTKSKYLIKRYQLKINKLPFYLSVFTACLIFALKSVSAPIDSLEAKLLTTSGIEKIDLLISLSNSYLNQHPQRSLELANEALELSLTLQDHKREATSLYCIADANRVKGDNIKALDFHFQALKLFDQSDDKEGIAKSANSIGRIYRFLGNYPLALDYHHKALYIYYNLENEQGISSSLINVGVVYRNLGKPDLALENYMKALNKSRENNDLKNLTSALISIGNVYWYDNENNKALTFYEEALSIVQQDDFEGEHPGGILNNIGNVQRQLGNFSEALNYYNQSLNVSREIGDKNLIAITLKNIGISYKETGKLSQAIQFLNEGKELAQQIHLLRIQRETLDQLSQTYTLLADYKKALEYYIEYSKLNDSLFDEETSNKISVLQLQHELKEKEQQDTIVEKDVELKSTKEKNLRNFIIFISLLAISLIVILWNRYKLKIKKNNELRLLNADLERRVEERTKRFREENEHRRIAQEQAELANETKNRFLATISHEVRTPINAIIGFCDLTIDSESDEDHKLNLKRVKDSSEHLLALIKDILDYSQIECGKMELKNESFNIHKIIESVVNAYYLDASSKEINLSYELGGNIPKFMFGDPDAIRQVLYNLIGNAIKFTDKGDVEVAVIMEEPLLEKDQVKLHFSIKDSGIGISKLKQKLIFMDFTQIDTTESRKYGGVGLGLTICKYFVEQMGGKISVKSEKGQGSEFEFTLVFKVDKNKSVKKEIKNEAPKQLHLLVAEDNMLNSQVVSAFLKRLGHTSKIAGNGKIALELLAKEDFDAVLMDIEMPEMDGIEATEAIRNGDENVRNPKIPVIALTAHALKDYEEKSYKAGMDSYLTKPIDIDKLSEVLQSI